MLILPKVIYELKVIAKTLGVNMFFETRQANYKIIVEKIKR